MRSNSPIYILITHNISRYLLQFPTIYIISRRPCQKDKRPLHGNHQAVNVSAFPAPHNNNNNSKYMPLIASSRSVSSSFNFHRSNLARTGGHGLINCTAANALPLHPHPQNNAMSITTRHASHHHITDTTIIIIIIIIIIISLFCLSLRFKGTTDSAV